MKPSIYLFIALLFIASCNSEPEANETPIPAETNSEVAAPTLNVTIKATHPHDIKLFTEGFLFHNDQLFESTGSPEDMLQTKSMIGISDLKTGTFTKKVEIDRSKYFGEGIVFLGNKLYQLTYKNQVGFIYDASSFKKLGEFTYANREGWSLTTDSTYLIMSDGTPNLTYIDPGTMQPVKTLSVSENGMLKANINELEFIKGYIYANVWMTNTIIKIDPANGNVVGKLDLTAIMNEAMSKNPQADVLNGIAYDPKSDKIYVTGKMWANIYEIEFVH